MSELKARRIGQLMSETGRCDTEVYLKSEADKVIAELEESHKKEVSQLLILNREQANSANRLRDSMEQVIRHQKYKRRLANAWWCRNLSKTYAWSAYNHRGWKIGRYYDEKAELYRKWRKRWLELAEKFKEAK